MVHRFPLIPRLITLAIALLIGFTGVQLLFASGTESHSGFVENRGQQRDDAGNPEQNDCFQSSFSSMEFQGKRDGLTIFLHRMDTVEGSINTPPKPYYLSPSKKELKHSLWRIDIRLVGGEITAPIIYGETLISGHPSFFFPSACDDTSDVPSYNCEQYGEVYPGIEWDFLSDSSGRFKHEFVVAPGADPRFIQLEYLGAEIQWASNGKDLVIKTPLGNLGEGDLKCYLRESGTVVPAEFLVDKNFVRYKLGPYPAGETLVIDPVFEMEWDK